MFCLHVHVFFSLYIFRLWQRPKDTFEAEDQVWYCNVPIGEKKLSSFMTTLRKSVGLSKVYTNHSIRATGTTILSKGMFGPAQVMAVTGHKSVQNLSVYQRVSNEEKIKMADTLFQNVVPVLPALPPAEELPCIMPPSTAVPTIERPAIMPPATAVPTIERPAIMPPGCTELAGVNVEDIFSDYDSVSVHQNSINMMRNSTHSTQPIFHNCTVNIQNLTLSHL